jgi:phosphate starvation-inducible protein PhoH
VAVVEFQPEDVVRHPLVQRIIVAYADDDVREAEARATRDDVRRRFRGGE